MSTSTEWNEEQLVEKPALTRLQQLGYTHVSGAALDEERETRMEVVLRKRLARAIKRLNPWIDDNNVHRVVRTVTHIEAASLMEANQAFTDMLMEKLSVYQDLGQGRKSQTVHLIDFDTIDNNEFLVVDQFSVTGAERKTNRPDLMIFVNGLPLVAIECKSPMLAPDQQIHQGVKQLNRYQEQTESLFYYNQFLIATSRDQAKTGTIGAKLAHYSAWKEPYPLRVEDLGPNATQQDILIEGMLRKERLFDLIQNFIVYEPENGRVIKKMGRYQQYRAVHKAVERILNGEHPQERGGVIWATQGSGKSLSMVFLATKLRRLRELGNPVMVIVTDRQDLDNQITKTFRRCGFPNPSQADSVSELKNLLQQGPGSTVMTLVQKFQTAEGEDDYPVLSTSENVIVMVDESHRSQYSSLAMNMRTALPNATYIGFTGTPIDKNDKSTPRTFGPYIDTYTIEQAVEDGATVPIFYESRMMHLQVQGGTIDDLFERSFREYSAEDRERIKQKYATEEAITAAKPRLRQVALDIVNHYESHIQPDGFKGQIVAVSREAAVHYKELLDEITDIESRVIISSGHNDDETMRRHHLTKEQERNIIDRFKKPMDEDPLSFLIVCDKLLTGFDAPIEQVMYLDKPLKEHNLLQAIARTNRTYAKKTYGLLVDYYGVSRFLEEALGIFHEEDVKDALTHVEDELPRLQMRHRQAMQYFDYCPRDDADACVAVLEPEDVRNEFDTAFKKFAESMNMVLPSTEAKPYLEDLRWLGKINKLAKSWYHVEEGMDISDCGEKVRQLIEEHVVATTPSVLYEPVNLLSDRYNQKLEAIKKPESKAAEMEHALKHEIRVKMDENPVMYTSLREKIEELIERRRERQLTIEEHLKELKQMRQQMMDYAEESESHGFQSHEYPFFQLLSQEMADHDEENVKELTSIILDLIKQEAVIDWTSKEEPKRAMRKSIKRQLRASNCPKDQVEPIAHQVIQLAEVHYKKNGY